MKEYPHVQGMATDVFFLTHHHAENGSEEDAVSKYNNYEVRSHVCITTQASQVLM